MDAGDVDGGVEGCFRHVFRVEDGVAPFDVGFRDVENSADASVANGDAEFTLVIPSVFFPVAETCCEVDGVFAFEFSFFLDGQRLLLDWKVGVDVVPSGQPGCAASQAEALRHVSGDDEVSLCVGVQSVSGEHVDNSFQRFF